MTELPPEGLEEAIYADPVLMAILRGARDGLFVPAEDDQ